MFAQLKELQAATAGRYKIFTEVTELGLEIICLDRQFNPVACRRLSAVQLQNEALRVAVINDLKGRLTRTYAMRVPQLIEFRSASFGERLFMH